jgi:hypothetical protein
MTGSVHQSKRRKEREVKREQGIQGRRYTPFVEHSKVRFLLDKQRGLSEQR